MAISNPQDTFTVTLGGESKDVLYTKKVYGTIEDVIAEAADSAENAEKILKLVNSAEDTNRKATARLKFLGDDTNAQAKAIDDQVKAYMAARAKAGKPALPIEQVRAKFVALAEE
jgi:sulfite reductase beta subunit-like hemoprotein